MTKIENSQVNITLQMLKTFYRYKDIDIEKPVLMMLPLDRGKHRDAVVLTVDQLKDKDELLAGIQSLQDTGIKNFQTVFRFPDGSDACLGDHNLEENKVGGQPVEEFVGRLNTWGNRAKDNSESAQKFWDSFPSSPKQKNAL